MAKYPDKYEPGGNVSEEEYKLVTAYVENLAQDLGQRFKVVRYEVAIPKTDGDDSVGTANGLYINFERIGSTVFVPQFGDRKADRQALRQARLLPGIKRVVPVSGVVRLSEMGGVIHCITAEYR